MAVAQFFQTTNDKWLEKCQRHLLGKSALVELELRSNHDHGTTGVVHALTKEILTETSALTLKHVGKRLESTVAGPGHGTSVTPVVEKGIDRFLQHALLVSDNDFRSLQLHQVTETIVPVDDTAIEIIQVGSRKAATFQRHQRTKVGRNDRENRHDHPLGTRVRLEESAGELEALGQLLAVLLRTSRFHGLLKLNDEFFKVGLAQEITNRLGTHSGAEGFVTIILLGVTEFILGKELASLKRSLARLGHKVVLIVNNTLKFTRSHVEDKPDTGGHALVEPNVGDRNS